MKRPGPRLKGRMRLTVRSPDGLIVEQREASNIVLHGGARLIARLFSGTDGAPINRVRVGFAREGGNPELTALSNPDNLPEAALQTPLAPDAFEIRDEEPGIVAVSISARFRPTVDLAGVTEAGLAAGAELYNQVVFEPVDLRAEQDITFFWEVEFPFGA